MNIYFFNFWFSVKIRLIFLRISLAKVDKNVKNKKMNKIMKERRKPVSNQRLAVTDNIIKI